MIGFLDHCLKAGAQTVPQIQKQFASWNIKHFLHPAPMIEQNRGSCAVTRLHHLTQNA